MISDLVLVENTSAVSSPLKGQLRSLHLGSFRALFNHPSGDDNQTTGINQMRAAQFLQSGQEGCEGNNESVKSR